MFHFSLLCVFSLWANPLCALLSPPTQTHKQTQRLYLTSSPTPSFQSVVITALTSLFPTPSRQSPPSHHPHWKSLAMPSSRAPWSSRRPEYQGVASSVF